MQASGPTAARGPEATIDQLRRVLEHPDPPQLEDPECSRTHGLLGSRGCHVECEQDVRMRGTDVRMVYATR